MVVGRVGAIVMAAGAGRRMGYRPKCLLQRDGVPLIERTVRLLIGARLAPVVVVLGHHADRIEPVLQRLRDALDDPGQLQWVRNPDPDTGQGGSTRCGLAALPTELDGVLIALADQLGAPIVHTLRSKQFIEYDNPFDVGMTGLLGFASGYRAMENCDTLLMLGTDFPYRPFLPDQAQVIQVDLRGEHLGRRIPLELGLVDLCEARIGAFVLARFGVECRHDRILGTGALQPLGNEALGHLFARRRGCGGQQPIGEELGKGRQLVQRGRPMGTGSRILEQPVVAAQVKAAGGTGQPGQRDRIQRRFDQRNDP